MQDSRIAGIRNASEKRGQPHYHAETDSWLDDHRARTRSPRVAYGNIVIHNSAIAIGSDAVRNVGTPTELGASTMKVINYIQLNKIDSAMMAFPALRDCSSTPTQPMR
jgi:hypothetical protein